MFWVFAVMLLASWLLVIWSESNETLDSLCRGVLGEAEYEEWGDEQ